MKQQTSAEAEKGLDTSIVTIGTDGAMIFAYRLDQAHAEHYQIVDLFIFIQILGSRRGTFEQVRAHDVVIFACQGHHDLIESANISRRKPNRTALIWQDIR